MKPVNIKKTAKLNLHEFIAPEKNKVVLSKAEISKIKIGAFVPPEKPKLDFAVNAKPETVIKPFEKPEFTLKAFLEVQKVNVLILKSDFTLTEISGLFLFGCRKVGILTFTF